MLFHNWLKDDSKIILFDGAFGTELIKRGLKPGKVPDLLNIENPEIITEIHKSYYDAGSDMCQSNTFGSTPINLKRHNIEGKITNIIEKALDNIKKAYRPGHLIVGDIGPTGEFRPPVGNASSEEWYSSFKTQTELLEGGVDLFHIETISDLEEMLAAIHAVKDVSNKPLIASITYKKTKRGYFTIMGDSLEKCIKTLENEKVDVVGANCTLGSYDMLDLVKQTTELTDLPISIKPNAGKPRIEGTKTLYDQPISEFVSDIQKMIDLGVKIVGGCCGTTPETIKEIRKIIDSNKY
ncbi:MAG: homocysteine S-methyltransferase family protein [Candidatus Lokiarchaeota archaeon]|nr:homocysteine S-methyltransferase family protein [Candidatus Lokiarchaeota archaeon]